MRSGTRTRTHQPQTSREGHHCTTGPPATASNSLNSSPANSQQGQQQLELNPLESQPSSFPFLPLCSLPICALNSHHFVDALFLFFFYSPLSFHGDQSPALACLNIEEDSAESARADFRRRKSKPCYQLLLVAC